MGWERGGWDWLQAARLGTRRGLLGRIRLRPGLPDVSNYHAALGNQAARGAYELEYYAGILTEAFAPSGAARFRAVFDVGCRNWSYVAALARGFPQARLYGVEVDGSWRYRDLYRRADYARAFAGALGREFSRRASCEFADFRRVRVEEQLRQTAHEQALGTDSPRAVLFAFFYPFVSVDPCRAWGLPKSFADFSQLLGHALGQSHAAGWEPSFLSVHQGEWERDLAHEAYVRAGIAPGRGFRLDPAFRARVWPSPHETYGWLS